MIEKVWIYLRPRTSGPDRPQPVEGLLQHQHHVASPRVPEKKLGLGTWQCCPPTGPKLMNFFQPHHVGAISNVDVDVPQIGEDDTSQRDPMRQRPLQ